MFWNELVSGCENGSDSGKSLQHCSLCGSASASTFKLRKDFTQPQRAISAIHCFDLRFRASCCSKKDQDSQADLKLGLKRLNMLNTLRANSCPITFLCFLA